MNLFESVKDTVTTRAAAEMYGLQVDRKGFCKCPFHADKNPGKVVDDIDAMDMNNKDIMGDVYEYLLGKIAGHGLDKVLM